MRTGKVLAAGATLLTAALALAQQSTAAESDWSGFYGGFSVGGGGGSSDWNPDRSPVQQVTVTTDGPAGCQLGADIYPILGSSVLSIGDYVQSPTGDILYMPNPLLFSVARSQLPSFNLIPNGSRQVSTANNNLIPTTVVNGIRIPDSSVPPAGRDYVTQPVVLAPGAQAGALRLGGANATRCGVVRNGTDLLYDAFWARFDTGRFVSATSTTTTTTAVVGPLAGGSTDPATLSALAGLAGQDRSIDTGGVLGGAQAGYNHQAGAFVFGVEADLFGSGIDGSETIGDFEAKTDINWFGTVRGRVGYAVDRFLVFGTAGVAYGNVSLKYSLGSASVSDNHTSVGWTAGAGAEYMLTEKVSIRAEYRHVDLGEETYLAAAGYDARLKTVVDIGLVGMNLHF